MKKKLNTKLSLYTILQILSITAFEKVPILQVFTNDNYTKTETGNPNQLFLFNF